MFFQVQVHEASIYFPKLPLQKLAFYYSSWVAAQAKPSTAFLDFLYGNFLKADPYVLTKDPCYIVNF
jgi:hypothetical protein